MLPRSIPRLTALIALVAAAGLFFITCARTDRGPASDTTRPSTGARLAAEQVLRVHLTGEPRSLDPHKVTFGTETSIVRQLFSPLLWFDQDMKVIPWVAVEVPTRENGGISPDGLTYTYRLRPDVKWSDGRPLTAYDFEWSFKRAMDPRTAGRYTSLYYDVKGARELNEATQASDAEIARLKSEVGVEARDERTLVFTLKNPRPSFPQLTALWMMYPLRREVIERYGDKWTEPGNLIGNGPFVLKEWVHDDHITLVRNEHWFAPLGDQPKLQTVIYRMIPDEAVAWAAYLNNELDISRVPPANRREVMTDAKWKNEMFRRPEPTTFALLFNNTVPPFDKREVRQAFGMAVDRDVLVNIVQQGVGRPVYSWIPPLVPGYDPELGKDIFPLNPTRAKQLLAQAGYPEGKGMPEIKITLRDNDMNRNLLVPFLQEQFRRHLGIELKAELLDSKSYQSAFSQGQFQLALGGWHADYPDQDNWLPNMFGCLRYEGARCVQYESNNVFKYSNPRFDDLARQAMQEPNAQRRDALWAEAHKVVIEDAAIAPLYVRDVLRVVKPTVRNLQYIALDSELPGEHYLFTVFIADR